LLLGFIQSALRNLFGRRALTDSFAGIVLAETFVAAPFLIVAARSAFASVDPVLEDVAVTLGRGPLATFIKVSLPLAWPAIRAGLLLAWLRAFGEFGATIMVAYHPYSLPVYTYVAFGSQGLPAMIPILLPTFAAAIAVFALSNISISPTRRRARIAAGPSYATRPVAPFPGNSWRRIRTTELRSVSTYDRHPPTALSSWRKSASCAPLARPAWSI
jgi:molybdate transport system permease protein